MPREAARPADREQLADLADLVLNVGRLIRQRTPHGPSVTLTETERSVMRVVDLFPASPPSEIARRTGLQRPNVSTALRGLEEKGMVAREPAPGRGVLVSPTPLAADNLRLLRDALADEMVRVLGDDLGGVTASVELLARLERSYTGQEPRTRSR